MRKALFTALFSSTLIGCMQASGNHVVSDVGEPIVRLRVLALNDLHGHLLPPKEKIRVRSRAGDIEEARAGGVEHLATKIKQPKRGNPNTLVVAAGDLVGASPFLSAVFHDEPTIESLGLMGLELSAVGNHEFDEGIGELLRKQNGGCHADGCVRITQPYAGAQFKYLAASTKNVQTGKELFPSYSIKYFENVPVAFIGLTLKGTPNLLMKDRVQWMGFRR